MFNLFDDEGIHKKNFKLRPRRVCWLTVCYGAKRFFHPLNGDTIPVINISTQSPGHKGANEHSSCEKFTERAGLPCLDREKSSVCVYVFVLTQVYTLYASQMKVCEKSLQFCISFIATMTKQKHGALNDITICMRYSSGLHSGPAVINDHIISTMMISRSVNFPEVIWNLKIHFNCNFIFSLMLSPAVCPPLHIEALWLRRECKLVPTREPNFETMLGLKHD